MPILGGGEVGRDKGRKRGERECFMLAIEAGEEAEEVALQIITGSRRSCSTCGFSRHHASSAPDSSIWLRTCWAVNPASTPRVTIALVAGHGKKGTGGGGCRGLLIDRHRGDGVRGAVRGFNRKNLAASCWGLGANLHRGRGEDRSEEHTSELQSP